MNEMAKDDDLPIYERWPVVVSHEEFSRLSLQLITEDHARADGRHHMLQAVLKDEDYLDADGVNRTRSTVVALAIFDPDHKWLYVTLDVENCN